MAHPGSIGATLQRYETAPPGYAFAKRVEAVCGRQALYAPQAVWKATGQEFEIISKGFVSGVAFMLTRLAA